MICLTPCDLWTSEVREMFCVFPSPGWKYFFIETGAGFLSGLSYWNSLPKRDKLGFVVSIKRG
jgi:hypothetical protein